MAESPGEVGREDACRYGSEYLLKQVAAVRKEVPGVLAATDIEHIHRMRVATRRLRSTLPLFPLCFSGKRIRRWRRGLREITRSLGDARDTDVQIAFLREFVSEVRSGRAAGNRAMLPAVIPPAASHPPVPFRQGWHNLPLALRNMVRSLQSAFSRTGRYLRRGLRSGEEASVEIPVGQPDLVPGMESVLLRKSQERARLQEGIVKALHGLERSGLLGEMERDLRRHGEKGGESMGAGRGIYASAFSSVASRIEDLLVLGEFLPFPGKIREHHALRIAVKQLRYTLEVWRDLYGGVHLGEEIESLKRLQDLLGDLHDCDVWIGYLPEFLREEEVRCYAFFGNDSHFRGLVPGIEALIRDRRDRRRQLHEMALTSWRDLAFRGFWGGLREKLLLPLAGDPGVPVRIGLLANISGDAGALRMALDDGRHRGAHLFLNAGDTLGSGRRASRETVKILWREGVVSVKGDRDPGIREGVPPLPGCGSGEETGRQGLSAVTKRFTGALPGSLRLSLAGTVILLVHGSPGSAVESPDARTSDERLCQVARETGASVIVTGHGGVPFVREVCHTLFVHPGSVNSGEGETRPTYTILEIGPDGHRAVTRHELPSGPAGPGAGGSCHPDAIPPGGPGDAGGMQKAAGD